MFNLIIGELAVVDPTPASTMRAGSNNNNDQGLRRWKVLIVAAIVLVAAVSVANSFEDSNLDTNVAKTVTNAGALDNYICFGFTPIFLISNRK